LFVRLAIELLTADSQAADGAGFQLSGSGSPEQISSQTYLNFTDDKQIGKDWFSRKEREGRQGDGPRPVIPSGCEGSKKDFSLRSK